MSIIYSKTAKQFHIFNREISYIIQILDNGQLGNLYFGKRIDVSNDYSYLLEGGLRSLAVYTKENDYYFSPQYTKMEYPESGRGDFREPAFEIKQLNGSHISDFRYKSYQTFHSKKSLENLPALYVENNDEAETLEICMEDALNGMQMILSYSIIAEYSIITRNVRFVNAGSEAVFLERALSASIDLPDCDYEMVQFSGAWARERHIKIRKLQQGIQGIESRRGCSSSEHNPFLILKKRNTDEKSGELYAFSFIYSGNHMERVEVDTNHMTRVVMGIHPDTFEWKLAPGESFQSPEAVILYTDHGLNDMSQTFHKLFSKHLVRGVWKEKERPILINNWEATGVDFTEKQILQIANKAKSLGVELFVLDDGWFGGREDDKTGLGDWYVKNLSKLPNGIVGLAEKIEKIGMKFGLWFEPEMVNKDSELYRKHPEWILCAPGREASPSRNQYVLDFSRQEVVDYIFAMMDKMLSTAPISYVKWDMNRYITECYSTNQSPDEQGKVYHLYILGVYQLYERLLKKHPKVLFESCSSGGARFDPGMLFYAPQTWTSDNTDAYERLLIQYGTSYVYPLNTMGAHVSEVPNQQVGRITPLETRANVAMFGVFGYELDLGALTEEETEAVKQQITFYKEHRKLLQFGRFYRLKNPLEEGDGAWMVVAEDQSEAIMGYYRGLECANRPWKRIHLDGLRKEQKYRLERDGHCYFGSELMYAGLPIRQEHLCNVGGDFSSAIYYFKQEETGNSH